MKGTTMRSEEEKCRWIDEYNKCWYWMPDSKMTCDCLDSQCAENCKEYSTHPNNPSFVTKSLQPLDNQKICVMIRE